MHFVAPRRAVVRLSFRMVSQVLMAAAAVALTACANPLSRKSLDNFSLTYKLSIQQGVVVTQEMADQLKPGMTRDQVRFVLGTPILTDPFHKDRWDYPFRFQPGRGKIEERRFTVFFEGDRFTSYNGDSLPTEEEFAKSRNFATTKIVRNLQPATQQKPQLPGSAPDISGTTVIPGRNIAPDRPAAPVDQTPLPATAPSS